MSSRSSKLSFIVCGGGMIGLSVALGLRQQGHQVQLIERGQQPELSSEFGARVSAIAHSSRALLQQLGVWQKLPAERLGPYTGMQVWEHDSFAAIEFNAHEVTRTDLGAIVENQLLEHYLWQAAAAAGVTIHSGVTSVAEQISDDQVSISLSTKLGNQQQLSADYLIAADGANSQVRQRAQLPLTFWHYQQHAIVATVRTELPHQGIARQAFTPTGPIAWLPLADPQQISLVWSIDDPHSEHLLTLSAEQFTQRLQSFSNNSLGQLTLASERQRFALKMQYCQRWLQQRLLVIGDAAHSIHPLAGQGANLGFADVSQLLDVFAEPRDDYHRSLRQWERERKTAAMTMIAAMEGFKRGFAGDNPLLKLLRGSGLHITGRVTPLKQQLMQIALGD